LGTVDERNSLGGDLSNKVLKSIMLLDAESVVSGANSGFDKFFIDCAQMVRGYANEEF
jgi:hypothetical protein